MIKTRVLPVTALIAFAAAVFCTARNWEQSGFGTAALITVLLIAALLCLRMLLRRDGLCRDRLSSLTILAPTAAMLLARLSTFETITSDFVMFLQPWSEHYRANGGFAALDTQLGNYNIPYLTCLSFFSYLPIRELYLIKTLSVLADLLLAYEVYRLTSALTDSPWSRTISLCAVMLLPTAFINGAVWGQCDSIYAAFAVAALASALKKPDAIIEQSPVAAKRRVNRNSIAAFTFSALALSFKLQAVFLLPILVVLIFAKKIRIRHIWVFPTVYLLAISPALIAGRGLVDTLTIYLSEIGTVGQALNYNSPSVFALRWEWPMPEMFARLGILAAAVVCAFVIYFGFVRRAELSDRGIAAAAAILAMGIPLFLPHMHERYFFISEVLLIPLICVKPALIPLAVLSQFASLLGYYAYLTQRWFLDRVTMRYGFAALAIAFAALITLYVRGLSPRRNSPPHLPGRRK
jgi:Gpi18-like mannosyltransferase